MTPVSGSMRARCLVLLTILTKLTTVQTFSALVCLVAAIVVVSTSDASLHVLAISVAGITLFATRSLPEATTALIIFLAFLAIGVTPPEVIFSGFAASGFWLLVGGLVIGTAITSSGLGDQIAQRAFVHTGSSYTRAVWVLSLSGLAMGALVPSAIPRVIVMMPITLALAKAMRLNPGSRGHTGLLMTSAMMVLVPTYAFLTANLPTIVEMGAIEILYGEHMTYGAYFVQNAPINIVRFVVLVALLLAFGRGSDGAYNDAHPFVKKQNFTYEQWRLLGVLICAIALWATDVWHGIAPAWVALSAAMVLLVPSLKIFPPQAMKTEIDFSVAFLIAAVFCISAVMNEVGLGGQIVEIVAPALGLGQGNSLWDLAAITGFSSALSHLTIAPAAPIVLAPLAASMSEATGWSITTVAMAHNIGFSTTIFSFQSPPLLIGIALAQIPVGALTRLCVVSAIVTMAVGIPLTWVCWVWLGLI
jgi:di/tricarboxylate transporter